jgi:hypothetical protein
MLADLFRYTGPYPMHFSSNTALASVLLTSPRKTTWLDAKALALIGPIDGHGNIINNSRLQDICKSLKGKEVMKAMRRYISQAMLTGVLTLGISNARVAGQERGGPVAARDHSELQRDLQDFETDVKTLRRSLRRHANQERIARARNRVRQDWYNIVLDRGLSRSAPNDLNQNLADRSGKQVLHHRTRS